MTVLWELLGEIGLWGFKQLIGAQAFNESQKTAFLGFVAAMANRSGQASKMAQDYAAEIAELKNPPVPKP